MAIRTAIQRIPNFFSPEQGNDGTKDDIEAQSGTLAFSDRSLDDSKLLKAFNMKSLMLENAADPDKLFGFRCQLLSAAPGLLESIRNDQGPGPERKQDRPPLKVKEEHYSMPRAPAT